MSENLLSLNISRRYQLRDLHVKYSGGVEEYIVSSLKPRVEDAIFSKSESIGGISRIGNLEFTTSLAASPHVDPCIPSESLANALGSTYGDKANIRLLNELGHNEYPPHFIVWWRQDENEALSFPSTFRLTEHVRETLLDGITDQVQDALSILEKTGNKGYVGGSWGNSTRVEREKSGLSRGGPTNPIGHLHIADYSTPYTNKHICSKLPLEDKLNLYRPLDQYLHEQLGEGMAQVIIQLAKNELGQNISIDIDDASNPAIEGGFFDGFEIRFEDAVDFPSALQLLSVVAGNFDAFYKELTILHKKYWMGEITADGVKRSISNMSAFDNVEDLIANAGDIVTQLMPTRSQLVSWCMTDKLQKYDDIRERIEESERQLRDPISRFAYDQLRLPQHADQTTFAMPEKMSFGYLFDPSGFKYSRATDTTHVSCFRLFPVYATTTTIFERLNGGLIRRAVS